MPRGAARNVENPTPGTAPQNFPTDLRPPLALSLPVSSQTTQCLSQSARSQRSHWRKSLDSDLTDLDIQFTSDEDESVDLHVPCLDLTLAGPKRSISIRALADSGLSSSFLADRVVDALGLVRRKLETPVRASLAIEEENSPIHTITDSGVVLSLLRMVSGRQARPFSKSRHLNWLPLSQNR